MTLRSLVPLLLAAALGFGALATAEESKKDASVQAEKLYKAGTKALDDERWKEAEAAFNDVLRLRGARSDAATYWLAYALNKQGRKAEALALARAFGSKYPGSSWGREVRALELEIRGGRGPKVNPDTESDDELKLMAINALVHTDPERAMPLLEKILRGQGSEELKERALFVLAQTPSPKARQVIADVARGNAHYLGVFGGQENRQLLEEIYRSTSNVEVKEQILHAYMVAGDRARVLEAARSEKSTELRGEAAHQLGVMGARTELWQLYKTERVRDVKEEIIQGLFVAGDMDHILELARTETDRELREEAIQKLGVMGMRTAPALLELYRNERDVELRKDVIQAFFVQGNARALIDIAKTEKDRELRQEAVEKLSVMNNKEATEYLLQFLND
jgi:HEAT repeat protein